VLKEMHGSPRHWDVWPLLGYYVACSGDSLRSFRGNLSVPSQRFKNPVYAALFIPGERSSHQLRGRSL